MEMSMDLVLVHFSISYIYKYCSVYAVEVSSLY